jgi:hypothetical protein
VSARDTFLQLGFVMMTFGAALGTWALLTGPLGKITGLGPDAKKKAKKTKPAAEDDPGA